MTFCMRRLTSGHHAGVLVVGVFAGAHQDRNGSAKLPHRVGVATSTHIADRERAARRRRIDMRFTDALDFAGQQRLGRGQPGLDLAAGIERINPSIVELEHLTTLRLPFGNRLVELGINDCCFLPLALHIEDAAELR